MRVAGLEEIVKFGAPSLTNLIFAGEEVPSTYRKSSEGPGPVNRRLVT